MIFFSNAGLLELRMMVQQAAPFIGQDDYARFWAIVGAVGSDGAMSEQDYEQMVSIIEPYLLQRDVPGVAKKIAVRKSAGHKGPRRQRITKQYSLPSDTTCFLMLALRIWRICRQSKALKKALNKKWGVCMDKQTIEIILKQELGYSEFEADITAQDLCNLQPRLHPALQKWISSREESDVEIAGFSAVQLMKKKHFTYPAALIALDWLIVDPRTAGTELQSDIKH